MQRRRSMTAITLAVLFFLAGSHLAHVDRSIRVAVRLACDGTLVGEAGCRLQLAEGWADARGLDFPSSVAAHRCQVATNCLTV